MTRTTRLGRFRRFTAGTATAVALASGIAFAFLVDGETYTGNTATSESIELVTSLGDPLEFSDLYPTSDPQPGEGRSQAFTITNDNPVDVAYVLSATDRSLAGSGRIRQFGQLYARLTSDGGSTVHYEGRLQEMFTESAIVLPANEGEVAFNLEVFLLESGVQQPQGITSTFDLTVDAQTAEDTRASQLD